MSISQNISVYPFKCFCYIIVLLIFFQPVSALCNIFYLHFVSLPDICLYLVYFLADVHVIIMLIKQTCYHMSLFHFGLLVLCHQLLSDSEWFPLILTYILLYPETFVQFYIPYSDTFINVHIINPLSRKLHTGMVLLCNPPRTHNPNVFNHSYVDNVPNQADEICQLQQLLMSCTTADGQAG